MEASWVQLAEEECHEDCFHCDRGSIPRYLGYLPQSWHYRGGMKMLTMSLNLKISATGVESTEWKCGEELMFSL